MRFAPFTVLCAALLLGPACAGVRGPGSTKKDGASGEGVADLRRLDKVIPSDRGPEPDRGPKPDRVRLDHEPPDLQPPPDQALPPDQGLTKPDLPSVLCPDVYENNNNCSLHRSLGSVTESSTWVSKTATLNPAGDVDWYSAKGLESSNPCIPFTSETFYFRARVVVPAGRTIKLCLMPTSCAGSQSCQQGSGPMTLEVKYTVNGTCTLSDDTEGFFLVQALDSVASCGTYPVSFNYNSK